MDMGLKFLAGLPIGVCDIGDIHPLTLREIATIGEIQYNKYLSALCFEIEDVLSGEDLDGVEGISTYDILMANCISNENYKELITSAISLFFKDDVSFYAYSQEGNNYAFLYLGELEEERIINKDNFENIKLILQQQNNIQRSKAEEYNPANEKARQLIEQIKKNRQNAPKPKQLVDLHSIISGVAWKGGVGIGSIWDLTIYQLYDAYYRLNIVDTYDKTLNGIYSGTVDGTKTDFKKLNWSNIIKLD